MTHIKGATALRIMVYSHDAFGLGNLRRMLAICTYLLSRWSNLSILLVSGSPMIQAFRLPKGLDYIKLPCLNRGMSGQLSAKYLGTSIEETVALRSQLIQAAAAHFKPNLLLVDKKPTGLKGELVATLDYLQNNLPQSKRALLLRDILDTPQKTINEWVRWRYYQTIQTYYEQILIVGMQTVFDLVQEYRLPPAITGRVRYCGYIRKWEENASVEGSAHDNVKDTASHAGPPSDRLVLVTPGGGEDGYSLISTYLSGLKALQKRWQHPPDSAASLRFHSLIICGPEMPMAQQIQLRQQAAKCSHVTFQSFTNEPLNCLNAANVVVSMSGYNTMTEILSLRKPAVVVPRIQPSREQLIRATRFAERGWVSVIHPDSATGPMLLQAVLAKLSNSSLLPSDIDFEGLPNIARCLNALISPIDQLACSSLMRLSA